jgi:hypothetical protein
VFSRKQSVAKRLRKKEEVKRQTARSPVGQVYCFPKTSFGVIFTEVFLNGSPSRQSCRMELILDSTLPSCFPQNLDHETNRCCISLVQEAEYSKSNAGRVARHCFAVRGLCASRRGVQDARCGGDLRKLVSESRSERRLLISSFLVS